MATKAELQAELDALKQTHADLKTQVVETARRYADENGWCSVVDEALEELGLEIPPDFVRLVVEFDAREFSRANDIENNALDIQDLVLGRVGEGYNFTVNSTTVSMPERVAA